MTLPEIQIGSCTCRARGRLLPPVFLTLSVDMIHSSFHLKKFMTQTAVLQLLCAYNQKTRLDSLKSNRVNCKGKVLLIDITTGCGYFMHKQMNFSAKKFDFIFHLLIFGE